MPSKMLMPWSIFTFQLFSLILSASATSRTSPPSGAVVVRAGTTTSGEYASVTAAVAALPNDSTSRSIFIYPGTYEGQVNISRSGPTTVSDNLKYTPQINCNKTMFLCTRYMATQMMLWTTPKIKQSLRILPLWQQQEAMI